MRFIVVPIFSDQRTGFGVKDTATGKIRARFRGEGAEAKATAKAAALNSALSQRLQNANGQSGSVFFTLFASVALVGVLGASTLMLMKGPLSTVAGVNLQVRTDSRLMVAGRLAAIAAASSGTDCDGDGLAEPLPPSAGPECAAASGAGGGCIPVAVGGDKADPWGTPIMYCAYDHGTGTTGCPAGLRVGNADPSGRAVLAVVSAGPDRAFQTTCADDPAYVTRGGDDRAYVFDESEAHAVGGTGGLWALVSGDPTTATIDKDLDISTGATFGGDVVFSSSASLTLGGSFLLPTDASFTSCLGPDKGALRTVAATDSVEICDGAGNWLPVGVRTFDALDDVPDYTGAAGRFVRVNGAADGVAFSSASLLDLSGMPATYTGAAGSFLRVNGSADGVAFASASLLDLSDTPNSYAGAAGYAVLVNGGGTGIEFVSSSLFVGPPGPAGGAGAQGPAGPAGPQGPAGDDAPDNFLDLTDTPNAYAGQGGKAVKVNSGGTALEFADDAGADDFLDLTDTPNSYAGEGGKTVKVKADASGLEFVAGGGALSCVMKTKSSAGFNNATTSTCDNGEFLTGGGCKPGALATLQNTSPGGVAWPNATWSCQWATAHANHEAFSICCKIQ
ncbi:hypothetical protein GHK68_30235 [Sinorhizobium meliloti]|uniref:hypothetical protein n=1 Tax=Rhizobium meliloti TaxID=382 RepID=UPI0012977DF9|nr:hypothetical protein [Sinorhizobium meliloti]MQW46407.1 hypothetical protein [Sinorhizobium meliloti]